MVKGAFAPGLDGFRAMEMGGAALLTLLFGFNAGGRCMGKIQSLFQTEFIREGVSA
jgi:hypothetical protein